MINYSIHFIDFMEVWIHHMSRNNPIHSCDYPLAIYYHSIWIRLLLPLLLPYLLPRTILPLLLHLIWIFHFIYGMSSFPLTNSYFSRWLYKTTNQIPYRLLFYNNECYYLTIISTWITTNCHNIIVMFHNMIIAI